MSPPAGLPRLLAGLSETGTTMSLAEHEHVHGPLPLIAAEALIEQVEQSGLRGRGGADFPTARKLRSIARPRRGAALVVNGSETEPASGKDRLLLTRLPHLVLDGATLVAATIGAPEVVVKTSAADPSSRPALERALRERTTDTVRIRVQAGPGGYVTGEESAVINHLNSGRAVPTFVPPRPYERGLKGRPTLVHNPETLAQVALVARHGPHWFRELGTDADPGSARITITGAVAAPGVYELSFGTPMADLLAAAGGATEPLRAMLIGGYFGTWVEADRAPGLELARDSLRAVGCSLGSGVLIALGRSSCGLHETARLADYLAAESAGQCGPCVHGLRAIADAVGALADGTAGPEDGVRLGRWLEEVRGRGACHHPDGAVRLVESGLRVFAPEIEHHRHSLCRARAARLPVPTGERRPGRPAVRAAR
jgi:NADH:ubiquinone oxidoreductase subunit F (NADH-binding)